MLKQWITRLSSLLLLIYAGQAVADRLALPALKQEGLERVLLLDVALNEQRLVAIGEQGVIIFSDDAGASWQQAKVPVSAMLTGVFFVNQNVGWAVGHDGLLLKTIDKGASWQVVLDGHKVNQLRVTALQESLLQLSATENYDEQAYDDLQFQLEDAQLAQEEGPSAPLLDVFFINEEQGFVVGTYGLFLITQDGGTSWQYAGQHLSNPDGYHLNKVFQTSSGELFLLGEAGLLLRSNDQGNSWNLEELSYEGSLFSMAESDHLYLMGLRGSIFQRIQNGEWKQISLPVQATINDAVVVAEKAYLVGQGGALLQQTNTGFTEFSTRGLRSFSAVVAQQGQLVAVGEGGVSLIPLVEGASNE